MPETLNFDQAVPMLIATIGQLAILSILLIGITNKIKTHFPEKWQEYIWVLSTFLGMILMVLLIRLFPYRFPLTPGQAIFFGFFVGLAACGLYDAGLSKGDSEKKKITP